MEKTSSDCLKGMLDLFKNNLEIPEGNCVCVESGQEHGKWYEL